MTRLRELSSAELAEVIRKRAEEARESDERFGVMFGDLLNTVEELARRMDENEGDDG